MPEIKGLLFDFDGLLVETEWSAYRAWAEIFEEHGHEFTLSDWSAVVGTIASTDLMGKLKKLTGLEFDEESLRARRIARKMELLAVEQLRPGVQECLEQSRELGVKTAIVTSSEREWIEENLERIQCPHEFDVIVSADGDHSIAKPTPTLYESALEVLGLSPEEAVAFEDSPNGIKAAKAAGLYCIAIPNRVTESLDLSEADLHLESLEGMDLSELLQRVSGGGVSR